jgi:TusA-related sulfurtransferase
MRFAFSDRLRVLLSDPEAERQLRSWMATGKPEFIKIKRDGDEITVRPEYVRSILGK